MAISKINSKSIEDLQISADDLASGSISTAKLADGAVTSAKLDTNIDVAGTLDVTGATTLDSTLAVVGNSTASTIALGGRSFNAGGTPLGVNFSSASGSGLQINDTNSGNLGGMLQFYSGSGTGTLRANIQNANNAGVHMCVGTGGSVVFTQTGYTAANALDDYEEGTFTPTLTPSTSGSITISSAQDTLKYIKIGNTVFIQGRLTIQTISAPTGASIALGNMPFTPSSSVEASGWFGGMCAISFNGSATFEPYTIWSVDGTVRITTTTASVNSNTRIHFNFFYETA